MRRTEPFVAVVGGVNVDLCGKPDRPLVARDSNPGRVTASLGGVGRNIAHDLTLLGVPTGLVTALGDDGNAGWIRRSCEELGIDLSHTLEVPGGTTSTYLLIADHAGEMELAVSDMAIYDHLTPGYIDAQRDFLSAAAAVAVDTNLPAPTLAHLAEIRTAPLFADAVSTGKAPKLLPVLDRLHTLKVNELEAQLLSGVDITDEVSLQVAANALLDRGVERVFITLGPRGVLAAERGRLARLPIYPGEMANATGCGDAFAAALVWAFLEGLDLERSARAGLAAAAIALAGPETINPALSVRRMKEIGGL